MFLISVAGWGGKQAYSVPVYIHSVITIIQLYSAKLGSVLLELQIGARSTDVHVWIALDAILVSM